MPSEAESGTCSTVTRAPGISATITIPGAVRSWSEAHRRHGRLGIDALLALSGLKPSDVNLVEVGSYGANTAVLAD